MENFNDTLKNVKEQLKTLLTAENTEAVTKLDAEIDKLNDAYVNVSKELAGAKDTLIDYVKHTSFQTPVVTPTREDPRDIDTVLLEELDKIISKKKEN